MDIKQIKIFIQIANLKNFSKVAKKFYLSQPAVSTQISNLEQELKVKLLNRNCKEVSLTSFGEKFLKYAIEISTSFDKALLSLSNNNISGTLKLFASTTPCNSILPNLIKKFNIKYPNIYFNILEKSSGKIIEDIINFKCELGFIGTYINNSKIINYKLVKDELILISSPELNIPYEIDIKSLLKYKFILREKGSATNKTLKKALKNKNIDINSLNICCQINTLDTLFEFVKKGIGISIVSKNVCSNILNTNTIKISKIKNLDLKRYIYLIISKNRPLTLTGQTFFNFCKNYFNINKIMQV